MTVPKAAKKAAKKAAAKHAPHKPWKDARRTFEHLERVQAIASLASAEQENVSALVSAADSAFRGELYKESADLLRAAEHLSFAGIVMTDAHRVSEELVSAIREEFDHLRERGQEHEASAEMPKQLRAMRARMIENADNALREGAYRRALELARGAEALAHVHHLDEKLLQSGEPGKRIQASR